MAERLSEQALIDREVADDVMYEFDRHHAVIEELIAASNHLQDEDALHMLLLEVHSVRENAAMVQLVEIMSYTNSIENIVFSIINQNIPTSAEMTEALLMAVDRLRDLHQVHLYGANFGNLNIQNIEHALAVLSVEFDPVAADDALKRVLWELTNRFTDEPHPEQESQQDEKPQESPFAHCSEEQQEDLRVFRSMALQIDNQCIFWRNRSDALCHWAIAINNAAGKPLDNAQLAAAIYLHDTGMAFIPTSILNKSGKLDNYEWTQLQLHPQWGYEVVKRMPGWEDAAEMILQHHERLDGTGYPAKLSEDEICIGAKLIAILDAFFAMIKPRADRPRRRSILRAISEINACAGTQFCEFWVEYFNTAIKHDMKDGLLLQISIEEHHAE